MIFRMEHESAFMIVPLPPDDVLLDMKSVASVYGTVDSVTCDELGRRVTIVMQTPEQAGEAMLVLDGLVEDGVRYRAKWPEEMGT